MNGLIVIIGGLLLPAIITFDSIAQGHRSRAKVLLELGDNDTSYRLNPEVLEEIKKLRAPIKVISAVGKARVGKSTMLNLINHILDEKGHDLVDEIFATGDSVDAVTRNVWVHIVPKHGGDDYERGSILFMDVEGTDLGDDGVTGHLSMFTAMMSSLLHVFARDYVGNHDKLFLYGITRLSDLVFQKQNEPQNFPKLHIIVRTDLQPRDENGDYIRDEIFKFEDGKIKKYFQQDKIEVSHIKSVPNASLLEDIRLLSNTSHWKSLNAVADIFRNSPIKKSLQGNIVNGEALKDLAEKLVEQMNKNEWEGFRDIYLSWEKDICRKSYEKLVKPFLKLTSDEMLELMLKTMAKFKDKCTLDSEIREAETELKEAVKAAKIREEEKARKEREKEQEERNGWFTYENLKVAGLFVGSHILTYLFSDEQLKTNVTTIAYSLYNEIGLNGVCWKWNEDAEKKFGLTGEECGVIAQEVKSLYPWAVVRSKDARGYLKVGYHILQEMIFDSLTKN